MSIQEISHEMTEDALELQRHHKTFELIAAAIRELSPEIAVVAIAKLVRTEPPNDHIWVRQQAKNWLDNHGEVL